MTALMKLLRRARANPRVPLVVLALLLVVAGIVLLGSAASREAQARKSVDRPTGEGA